MQTVTGRGILASAVMAVLVVAGCGGPRPVVTATTTSVTTVIPNP